MAAMPRPLHSVWKMCMMHRQAMFWAASDVGWVVGHSFIVYGPLLAGCTTVFVRKPCQNAGCGCVLACGFEHRVQCDVYGATAIARSKKTMKGDRDPGSTTCRPSSTCSWRARTGDPATYHWIADLLHKTGDRSLVADGKRANGPYWGSWGALHHYQKRAPWIARLRIRHTKYYRETGNTTARAGYITIKLPCARLPASDLWKNKERLLGRIQSRQRILPDRRWRMPRRGWIFLSWEGGWNVSHQLKPEWNGRTGSHTYHVGIMQ